MHTKPLYIQSVIRPSNGISNGLASSLKPFIAKSLRVSAAIRTLVEIDRNLIKSNIEGGA